MKKILILTAAFFLILLLLAGFTKPTRDNFLKEAQTKVMEMAGSISTDPVMVDVVKMQQDYLMLAMEKTVHSKDFYFFNVQSFELGDGEYKYLGVFGHFFPLQKQNPLDQFYQNHEEN